MWHAGHPAGWLSSMWCLKECRVDKPICVCLIECCIYNLTHCRTFASAPMLWMPPATPPRPSARALPSAPVRRAWAGLVWLAFGGAAVAELGTGTAACTPPCSLRLLASWLLHRTPQPKLATCPPPLTSVHPTCSPARCSRPGVPGSVWRLCDPRWHHPEGLVHPGPRGGFTGG